MGFEQVGSISPAGGGKLLVSDTSRNTVDEIDAVGNRLWSIGVHYPSGAVRLANGNTVVADGTAELYHLTSADDRHTSPREAFRVLAVSGVVAVAAVSRYASALDGLTRKLTLDPAFVQIRNRDLIDGQHRNDSNHPQYFTTAYFHRPEDLHAELERAGFAEVRVVGVEGPGWMLSDFEARWEDEALRKDILETARALESERSGLGVSAHLLGLGRKPVG